MVDHTQQFSLLRYPIFKNDISRCVEEIIFTYELDFELRNNMHMKGLLGVIAQFIVGILELKRTIAGGSLSSVFAHDASHA